jgi:hypothetical protein
MPGDSDSDADPDSNGNHNGLSNTDIEQLTWDWFSGAVAQRFGPAHYQLLTIPEADKWPDVVALRAHDRVAFEITSPLRPDDVVKKPTHNGDADTDDAPVQIRLEQRVMEALKRKIKKYGSRHMGMPLGLLITLAHPSSQQFSAQADMRRLRGVVCSHLANFLRQPLDAVYLVGPGEKARLLWRRRGSKWKKIFPELDTI